MLNVHISMTHLITIQAPVSISDNTSYRKISQSLEAARFVFRIVHSLRNLTGTSATLLPTCLSNLKAMLLFKLPISQLRIFTKSYDRRLIGYWNGASSLMLKFARMQTMLQELIHFSSPSLSVINKHFNSLLLFKVIFNDETYRK